MDKEERIWFGVLIAIFLVFNVVTLSPIVPWQKWLLWSNPTPSQRIEVAMDDYQITLPAGGVTVKAGEYVEFSATTADVTYGFGVFRQDGSMMLQMQVLPGHANEILWKFDDAGEYDIRSTEYSGPRHSEMLVKNAIQVIP